MGGFAIGTITPRLTFPWGAAVCWEMMVFKHGSLGESLGVTNCGVLSTGWKRVPWIL